MPIIKSSPITVIDSSSSVNLELFISSNLPTTQILKSDNSVVPSWSSTPLVLTPSVYVSNTLLSNPNVTWQRRSGAGAYTSLLSGETVSNGVLTVNSNLLTNDPNGIITYKCTVTYNAISRFEEITYSLNVLGADGKDGSSVSIKGTAYISENIEDRVVGQNYILYTDEGLTTKITSPELGDSYLVQGHLFVYSGAANSQFNCVGEIKGVGISSITGPVSSGIVDTYTIHYSDGTTSSYDVINGKSVYVTYNDSETQPNTPTGNGILNGWHTALTGSSIWMSQKVADDVYSGNWGVPIRIKGIDGRGITSTSISYQISTSGSSVPNGTWDTSMPKVDKGEYLWTKTTTYYTDGSFTNAYSVGRIGTDGTDGSPGRGVQSTEISYKAHTSGVSEPDGTWSPTIPAVADEQYLWTRTVIKYTDGTSTTSYSVSKIGKDGYDGFTVVLTNETYTFAGTEKAAVANNINCSVLAYSGTERVAATIGTITGIPSGMTVNIYQNNTVNAYFKVTVTSSMSTASGFLTVPITVDGNTFTKTFSYAIAFKGESGVTFNIYSETGMVFNSDDNIILKLQKMHGSTSIALGGTTTVQWSKLVNGAWVNTWKYDSGDSSNVVANTETLTVKRSEVKGSQLYKCTLKYNGDEFIDVVTITDKLDSYQSKIISIGGNVLTGGDSGVVAYAIVFHDAVEEDSLLYPIYEDGTTPTANATYYVLNGNSIITQKYSNSAWANISAKSQKYTYTWVLIDSYSGKEIELGGGKVIYIPHNMISSSSIVQCRISDISVCTEVFIDANDPIIGDAMPLSTSSGQLWYNTNDKCMYIYNAETKTWNIVNSGQNRTYMSAPINEVDGYYYHKGDLWIVSESDSAYTDVRVGSLLIAINDFNSGGSSFNASAWKGRLSVDWENKLYYDEQINEIASYQDKLSTYFNFESDGLKIGANNTEFYTKVTPYDLGFYQGVEKVAYISNNKMYNTSLEVSNSAQIVNHKSNTQPNPQKPYFMIGNYKFIIEENNSMSIAYSLISAPRPNVTKYSVATTAFAVYFNPWSTSNANGYRSHWDTTILETAKLYTVDGVEIPTTKTYSGTYIRLQSTSALPKTFIAEIPAHSVYNQGISGNTLGYDLVDVGNDLITLTINR